MAEVKARTVLWYLVFIGFAVNYMIRINLNITIVEMIVAREKASSSSHNPDQIVEKDLSSQQSVDSSGSSSSVVTMMTQLPRHTNHHITSNQSAAANATSLAAYGGKVKSRVYSLEQHFLNLTNIEYEHNGFQWNEYQQGLVLGSFYWAHWILQIPGGILAKKYGTKLVFGLSNAFGCWISSLIPILSYLDYRLLICLRIFQGLITGLAWPAMHTMTAKWIPPNERSKFVTSYLGSSVGIAIFYPFFGYVMHWSSWEWVFHICAIIGTIWWFGWLYFVYDSPAEHPRISENEIRDIEKSLGASLQHKYHEATPWRAILISRPVWMNVIAQWGGIWGLFTLMTQAPTYFRVVHHLNIRATGSLSGLPHLMRMLFALVFSWFADFVLRTNKMSRTNLRKLATAFCCILNGIVVLGLAYYGYNAIAAIVCLTLATMFHGAVSAGPLASIVDIAPNHAGVVLGISGMIGVLPGFISPWIVGILTLGNQTFDAWKTVFLICSGMLIGSGTLYVLFSNSSLQPWNSTTTAAKDACIKELKLFNDDKEKLEELKLLKSDDNDNDKN